MNLPVNLDGASLYLGIHYHEPNNTKPKRTAFSAEYNSIVECYWVKLYSDMVHILAQDKTEVIV